jgi:hypothetical protein
MRAHSLHTLQHTFIVSQPYAVPKPPAPQNCLPEDFLCHISATYFGMRVWPEGNSV